MHEELDEWVDFDNPREKERVLEHFATIAGKWDVTAKPWRPKHSDPQRKYYFGVLIRYLMKFLNRDESHMYTKEQCHDLLARDCLPMVDVVHPVTGEVLDSVRTSITKLNKLEMGRYIDRAREHMRAFGVWTPAPDPNWRNAPDRKRAPAEATSEASKETTAA